MPRIGEALYRTGTLSAETRENVRNVFLSLRHSIDNWNVQTTLCAATSALRDAPDSADLITELSEIIEAPIRILSGEEEARLTALGIIGSETDLGDDGVFIDVGGGSTELSRYRKTEVTEAVSLNLGALRLNKNFLRLTPDSLEAPHSAAVEALREHIRSVLETEGAPLGKEPVPLLVGSSGTVRTLAALSFGDKRADGTLTRTELDALLELLTRSTFEEIAAIEGMERNRADIIVAGAVIVQEVVHLFNAGLLRASKFSLRHGLLQEHLQSRTKH